MEEGTSKSSEHCNTHTSSNCLESQILLRENDNMSTTSKEINTQRLDINTSISINAYTNTANVTNKSELDENMFSSQMRTCLDCHVNQGRSLFNPKKLTIPSLQISSNLPSPLSVNIPLPNQPQTLFILVLSKLNASSLNIAVDSNTNTLQLASLYEKVNTINHIKTEPSEITPPDSLTSAPPSYSFVLRQMAVRRRPRLMGTFIPSPSFVQHTPPPNYATAFDIYVDNPIPAPPPRVSRFGFAPMPMVCPECGYTGMTMTACKITICTHLCALVLCLLCCWICAPLPYVLKSCKDVYHYCRNCRNFLGMYCPTNPENAYS